MTLLDKNCDLLSLKLISQEEMTPKCLWLEVETIIYSGSLFGPSISVVNEKLMRLPSVE